MTSLAYLPSHPERKFAIGLMIERLHNLILKSRLRYLQRSEGTRSTSFPSRLGHSSAPLLSFCNKKCRQITFKGPSRPLVAQFAYLSLHWGRRPCPTFDKLRRFRKYSYYCLPGVELTIQEFYIPLSYTSCHTTATPPSTSLACRRCNIIGAWDMDQASPRHSEASQLMHVPDLAT